MGVHFYETSPSGPDEQRARLGPPTALLRAGIPSVVWAEDALSIVHRVPTALLDQQLLVPDDRLEHAAQAICAVLPYTVTVDDDPQWKDYGRFNKDRPHAFDLNKSTMFLQHHNPTWAWQHEQPSRIFIHAASVFHFDIQDSSSMCLNPSPPFEDSRQIRFPTLAAFYDALIATRHDPPLPVIHQKFQASLATFISYLTLYTLSDKGITSALEDANPEPTVIPACLDLLEKIKHENRPFLIRHFLSMKPLEFEESAMERLTIKQEHCQQMGIPYYPPTRPLPYNPFFRSRGRPVPIQEPRLTPYLIRNTGGKLALDWRPLAKYASIAHRMLR